MAEPIYKLFLGKWKEAWYQLSEEERTDVSNKAHQAIADVGGKAIVVCDSRWADEQWAFFGVEEYPSIEAVQQVAQAHSALGWHRYLESKTLLGTALDESPDS